MRYDPNRYAASAKRYGGWHLSRSKRAVVAIEGPCCAGKTTLSLGLQAAASLGLSVHVRDYSDFVGGGRNLPPPVPMTELEEREALKRFVELERERTSHVLAGDIGLVIIDRSLHTLIGHCSGIESRVGYACADLARGILLDADLPLWPDVVIYLDASVRVINTRNKGKFPAGSVFMDEFYNNGFKEYFESIRTAGKPAVVWIDGSLPCETVLAAALSAILAFVKDFPAALSVGGA